MEGLSERLCAARVGLSRAAIQKVKVAGRLVLFSDDSINVGAIDARRAEITDPSKDPKGSGAQAQTLPGGGGRQRNRGPAGEGGERGAEGAGTVHPVGPAASYARERTLSAARPGLYDHRLPRFSRRNSTAASRSLNTPSGSRSRRDVSRAASFPVRTNQPLSPASIAARTSNSRLSPIIATLPG